MVETSNQSLILRMGFKYRATVLDELARHGVIPFDDTPPETVHQFVNDLYIFEIRRLKKQLLSGNIPRPDYSKHVVKLRNRYPILSLPVHLWTEPS